MKKFISGLVVGIVAVLVVNISLNKDDVTVIDDKEARVDRIVSVLNSGWDKFGLIGFGIGDTDPTITIQMDNSKSEQELREYLQKNIEKHDLIYYDIEVLKMDIQELEKEHSLKPHLNFTNG